MEELTATPLPSKEICVSCGARLKGNYCKKCGEKKIIPERDFRLSKFLSQSLWHFVRFDSKLLQSVWLLFSKPGFLTSEWIAGRRVNYMKPLQLFVIASLLFYFFLPTVPAYYSPTSDLMSGYVAHNIGVNTFHSNLGKIISEKALVFGVDEKEFAVRLDSIAARQSKTWLFFIIPFWGSLIFLLYHRTIPWLAPHLIFAMHGLTFNLLADLSIHFFLHIFGIPIMGQVIFLILMFFIWIYQFFAVQRVYGSKWFEAIFKSLIILVGLISIILIYRQVITVSTLFFMKGI
ncbi:MAG: DUF3667 domain-containing protein [Saprospiraceae bacterium]